MSNAQSQGGNVVMVKAMFGDVFGQRGDYSKGIVYGSRRKYLATDGQPGSTVSPPEDLMTKSQARHALHHKKLDKDSFKNRATVYFTSALASEVDVENSAKASGKGGMFQRGAKNNHINNHHSSKKNVGRMIVIEKFSTTNKAAWTEELQAGCKIYVNKETGEVFDECPWVENGKPSRVMCSSKERKGSKKVINTSDEKEKEKLKKSEEKENDKILGTGSLVYDEAELQNFFETLDTMK